jgi:hypothetical protein
VRRERCDTGDHEAARADDARWRELRHDGFMEIEPDEHEPGLRLELRTCMKCKSTLARPA